MKPPAIISRNVPYRVVLGCLLLLMTYALLLRNVVDYDLWGVLSIGALIEQTGFPYQDVFSYTAPGAEWIYHEWGSGVIFYHLLTTWGDSALFVAKLLLFAASLLSAGAIHRAATASDQSRLPDGVFFLAALPGCFLLLNGYLATVRCHSFSFLGYLLFLWILDTYRRNPNTRAPWLLPPIMAIWVNVHGGFALGFFALGLHWVWLAWERRKQQAIELAILGVFCLGALLLNPYGWRYVPKIVEAWTMSRAGVGEWGTVWTVAPALVWPFAVLAVATLAPAAWNSYKDRRFPGVFLLLAGTGVQGALHVKLIPFFAFTALALGVAEICRAMERLDVPLGIRDLIGLLIPAGVGTATAFILLSHLWTSDGPLRPRVAGWNAEEGRPVDQSHYPLGAVAYLSGQKDPVRLWSPFHWGEFIAWSLYPNTRVSMDGRFETLYPESVRRDHLRVWSGDHDLSVVDDYDTTHILVPTSDFTMIELLDDSAWSKAYEDPLAVVYVRQEPAGVAAARNNDTRFLGDLLGDVTRFRGSR